MISLLFAIIGLLGIIWCLVIISRSIDSERWPRIDCTILDSGVQQVVGEFQEYRAIIRYSYTVNGVAYEGNTVRLGRSSIWKSAADTLAKRYPKGSVARLSIDPNNPQRSVLVPGVSPSIYLLLVVFTGFLLIGGDLFLN